MKKILSFLLVIIQLQAFAQAQEGTVVTYEKKYFWSKIYDKLTFLSEEERSRAKTSWGSSDEGYKSRGQLFATSAQSKYMDMEDENEGGYSWRKGEYTIYRDFDKGRKTEIEDFSGKTFIIEDTLIAPAWKVLNKIKDINGYMCMMATAEDTIKEQKIVAWFAADVPLSVGPERYFGLPGLIMEVDVNDGEMTLTAVKVEKKAVDEDIKLPKKMKGKKLTTEEYNRMIRKFIDDSIKSRRNPYGIVRY